ncbi:HIT family protein [Candidatus Protochlamydia naegleriophila]|uniref:HIT family protein n=1 Tax=Candidatus Protochlamydia naegleriophila TaxID=389348 RepID=A0A0U5JG57_9BACT|nr:HIT domain-containing protein [Candidatus Protochlamydia naegleriophila]CUI17375.1 HIT family protein [Candidatus Protochlamydia naegleriophila]
MTFELHSNLRSKAPITILPLCQVLLEDNLHYPWLIVVPQRPHISRLMDLNALDQMQLIKELDCAQKILWEMFFPSQLNVAAIGNKTPQLHVHVIARFQTDPAWPGTVWDHPARTPYAAFQKEELIGKLKEQFDLISF